MFPFKIQNFGIRERNWTEDEYEEKERLIMHTKLANYESRHFIAIGVEEKRKFER